MFFMRNLLILFLFFNAAFGQTSYPKDYFRYPLGNTPAISGSFGELRPGHFHSGLDFKTDKQEGLPVYAAADGFISRIRISTSGYGKSIYIDHPNGFTTVYGHLQRTTPEIQAFLDQEHYSKQSYEIDIYLNPKDLIVKKGDIIAYSGNTGGSGGPHLHFEFRETASEKVLNPLLFGFDSLYKDTKAPIVNGIIAYPKDDFSQVNGNLNPVIIPISLQKDGTFLASKVKASGKLSFGINTYDMTDNSFNKFGIYKMETFLNGVPYFNYDFESFSFAETRYINTFIDYSRYENTRQRYQKLFVGNFYPGNIIKFVKNDGVIDVSQNFTATYRIEVQDFFGNKNIITIPIEFSNPTTLILKNTTKSPYFLKSKIDNSYSKDDISVFFKENTFYEDFYLNFDVKNNELFLHDDSVAVKENFVINFDVSKIPVSDREKMFIANLNDGKISYQNTIKNENTFSTWTKSLGKFYLTKDVTAPRISKPNFVEGSNLDNQKTLQVYISDDLSGIKSYNAYLNGNWILMEYESKLNKIFHNLSGNKTIIGKNELKIVVEDNVGNVSTFQSTFTKTK
jgi:murein DD-endopeptidase MepM/ murein hydrolase activator NlpD